MASGRNKTWDDEIVAECSRQLRTPARVPAYTAAGIEASFASAAQIRPI